MKLAAVEKFLAGAGGDSVVVEFGISNRTVFHKWVALYLAHGVEGLNPKPKGRKPGSKPKVAETDQQKISRLEFEVEALKKLEALVASEQRQARKR